MRALLPWLTLAVVGAYRPKHVADVHSSQKKLLQGKKAAESGYPGIAIGMLTTSKEPYKERWLAVRETWPKYFRDFQAYTFDALAENDTRVKLDLVHPKENSGRATGLNLAILPDMLRRFPDALWFLQTDDDSFMLPGGVWNAVQKWIDPSKAKEPRLAGKCVGYPHMNADGKHDKGAGIPFVVGGAGLFMSRGLVEALVPHVDECRKVFSTMDYGDSRIGGCVARLYGVKKAEKIVQCLPGARNELLNTLRAWVAEPEKHKDEQLDGPLVSLQVKNPCLMAQLWQALTHPARIGASPVTVRSLADLGSSGSWEAHCPEEPKDASSLLESSDFPVIYESCQDVTDILTFAEACGVRGAVASSMAELERSATGGFLSSEAAHKGSQSLARKAQPKSRARSRRLGPGRAAAVRQAKSERSAPRADVG